jgi:hypothetical protein
MARPKPLTQEQQDMLENLKAQYLLTEDRVRLEERLSIELSNQNKSIAGYIQGQDSIRKKVLEHAKATKALIPLEEELNKLIDLQKKGLIKLNDQQKENFNALKKTVAESQKNLGLLQEEINIQKDKLSLTKAIGNSLMDGAKSLLQQYFSYIEIWNYLQKIDKEIRMNQLLLGLSGEKAKVMREQLEGSVNAAAYLGASLKDIVDFQQAIAAQTGRAYLFSKDENIMMAQLVKGTGLQNDEVSNLVSNMMKLGPTLEASKQVIEDSINSTARLGLSSNNVLKKLNQNIDKVNTYRFQNGVKGLEQMAKYSETFKVSMENAFAAADKFRTLEGLLETGANLRVLGGEFAKMDEFKLSFLARNKPQEFALELAKLTKGMASFNKETGEFDVSDIDMDRLRSVAELTGQDFGKLVESAKQFSQIDLAKKQILIGDSKDKEMIANLAKFKAGSNIGIIQVGNEFVKLTDLTDKHLSALKIEEKTLEQRAIDSQNFNDALTNLVSQLKSTLIPALTYINDILTGFNSFLNRFRDEKTKELTTLGAIMAGLPIGAVLIGPKMISALYGWLKTTMAWQKASGFFGGGTSAAASTTSTTMTGSQALGAGKGAMYKSFGTAATLAAIGVAAMGIGFGFKMAAEGAASLSDSLAKLTGEQLITLQNALKTIGSTMLIGLAAGILAVGVAGEAGAIGLLAVGAAALMVGAGIGLAAMGVGKMAEGFATLDKVDLTKIGSAMWDIAKSSILLATPASILGLSSLEESLNDIAGLSFTNVVPLQNLKFIDKDIENMKQMAALLAQINAIDTSKLDALGKLFSSGTMKVQLEGNPVIHIENKIDVDGTIFYKKVERAVPIIVKKGFDTRSIDWKSL